MLSDDRGVVGVFVAISMVVLLGMVGLAIDVGAMYDERRQLSNGADAAVLAIAEDCALQVGSCDSGTALATARSFADANARDGYSSIEELDLDTFSRTVSVVTGTLDAEGDRVLQPFFARVVGFDGATIHASASAEWGFPNSIRNALPLIISECEFPTASALPTPEQTLYFHDGNNAEPCNAEAGHDADGDGVLAGGFGWLATDGDCSSDLTADLWEEADTGASPTTGCTVADIFAILGEDVPLPIFDDLFGTGNNGEYHIAGFALFHVTGFNFGGQFKANEPCHGDERCMSGFFTTGVVHDGDTGGENRGIVIVKLTG